VAEDAEAGFGGRGFDHKSAVSGQGQQQGRPTQQADVQPAPPGGGQGFHQPGQGDKGEADEAVNVGCFHCGQHQQHAHGPKVQPANCPGTHKLEEGKHHQQGEKIQKGIVPNVAAVVHQAGRDENHGGGG
jgi:hypothetical protein